MARFFFKFDGDIFKARKPMAGEEFSSPLKWKDVEFQMTNDSLFMMAWTSLLPDLNSEEARALVEFSGARYPVSPDYESLRSLSPDVVVGPKAVEWVFFGGTFHPWHAGHQACLKLLPDEKMCFVTPDRNPLKELRDLDPVTTIIELSSRIKFKKNQFLCPTFLMNKETNPTVDWILRLRAQYPRKIISLLIGYDSLITLNKWQNYEGLLKALNSLYVVSRLEREETRETVSAPLRAFNSNLNIIFLGRHEHEGLSSTSLRRKS